MVNRYEALGIALMAAAVAFAAPAKAEGRTVTIRVVPGVIIAPGLPQAPVAHDAYRTGQANRALAPSARVHELVAPAPANGCARPAFEVVSGPKAQRGCYGTN